VREPGKKNGMTMSKLERLSITAVTLLLLEVGASAGKLPQYEVAGLPISPHQLSVLGMGEAKERLPTPTLTLNGMPASPHQLAVLAPRTKRRVADEFRQDRAWTERETTGAARVAGAPQQAVVINLRESWSQDFSVADSINGLDPQ
jgi:hypothetical protein